MVSLSLNTKANKNKKLCKPSCNCVGKVTHDPEKMIDDFSSHTLTKAGKSF